MTGSYICDRCNKSLESSQSLWNHKQRCRAQKMFTGHIAEGRCIGVKTKPVYAKSIPDSSIHTCAPFPDITKPKKKSNSKIEALVDAIINDDPDDAVKDEPVSRKRTEEDETDSDDDSTTEPAVKKIKKVLPLPADISSMIPERSIESIPPLRRLRIPLF